MDPNIYTEYDDERSPVRQAYSLLIEFYNNHPNSPRNRHDAVLTEMTPLDLGEVKLSSWNFSLGNWKAEFTTTRRDNRIYILTYNRAKGELYIDVFRKETNACIKDED